ncbi:MAG TPA: hypothetical protein VHO25_22115 [Polyangiaceae bacterium]|nr:hypothetical protein [Polyangiaceae bacterium]
MATRTNYIGQAWERFEAMVLPQSAGAFQRNEMRKAFFAGATILFEIMNNGISDGLDVNPEDMTFMNDLNAEMVEFGQSLDVEVFRKLKGRSN